MRFHRRRKENWVPKVRWQITVRVKPLHDFEVKILKGRRGPGVVGRGFWHPGSRRTLTTCP